MPMPGKTSKTTDKERPSYSAISGTVNPDHEYPMIGLDESSGLALITIALQFEYSCRIGRSSA
jgi:hypothetical protein